MVVVARETRPAPEEAAPDVLINGEEGGEPCSQIFGAEGQQELSPEQRELALEHRFARPARGSASGGLARVRRDSGTHQTAAYAARAAASGVLFSRWAVINASATFGAAASILQSW